MNNTQSTIRYYHGKTFVAFLDIAGFKGMLARGKSEAREALNKFYSTIFRVGKDFRTPTHSNIVEVDAIAVSDCAVLFTRIEKRNRTKGLRSMLEFIRKVNGLLIMPKDGPQILTTCSVDYGDFRYEDRMNVSNVKEVFFVGEAYVNAFLDNEFGDPRLLPGQCRLLSDNLKSFQDIPYEEDPFFLVTPEGTEHWYYYWMVGKPEDIGNFRRKYKHLHQDVYKELKKLIRGYVDGMLP